MTSKCKFENAYKPQFESNNEIETKETRQQNWQYPCEIMEMQWGEGLDIATGFKKLSKNVAITLSVACQLKICDLEDNNISKCSNKQKQIKMPP